MSGFGTLQAPATSHPTEIKRASGIDQKPLFFVRNTIVRNFEGAISLLLRRPSSVHPDK
jgi:hypothetical protein